MRLWRKTEQYPEGKFLVVRRDGSIPAWPHFVLGARDPAAPVALQAYADKAEELGYDAELVADVRELADELDAYRELAGEGDPEKGPHRKDDPAVIEAMRRQKDMVISVWPSRGVK
jgi:hypothetical protein